MESLDHCHGSSLIDKAYDAAEQYNVSVLKEYQEGKAGGYVGSVNQYLHVVSI